LSCHYTKTEECKTVSTSNYKADALKAREKLESVSPTMCLAKWNQVSLHLPTGLTNSCYHPPLHKIDAERVKRNPAALHNTAEKLQQRDQMLKGERPDGCSYCWKMEDTGEVSDRHYRSGEPWAMQDFDDIRKKPIDDKWTPRYVEVNFNHACNFKCSYCSPQFSTTWGQETERYGEYPTTPPHNAPEHFQGHRRPIPNREDNAYVTAFWKWWPTLYKNLKHFRMTGGEPMMDPNTYRVFQYIIDHPKDDLHLNVTSNMCPPDKKLKEKYFNMAQNICTEQKVEHMMQFVSVDAYGERAEYIRNGLDFNYMMDNVEEFLDRIKTRNSITFICTYNNLSVTSMDKLLEKILELRKRYTAIHTSVCGSTCHYSANPPGNRSHCYQSHTRAYMRRTSNIWYRTPASQTGYTYSRTSRSRRCGGISPTGARTLTRAHSKKRTFTLSLTNTIAGA